jgi:transposase-like protein
MPRPYPPEFRFLAVALVRAGKPITTAANELGISAAALHSWVRQDQVDRSERPGLATTESVQLTKANIRIRQLEVEILRTAATLFGENRPTPKRIHPVIDTLVVAGHPVQVCCRLLGVSSPETGPNKSLRSVKSATGSTTLRPFAEPYSQPGPRCVSNALGTPINDVELIPICRTLLTENGCPVESFPARRNIDVRTVHFNADRRVSRGVVDAKPAGDQRTAGELNESDCAGNCRTKGRMERRARGRAQSSTRRQAPNTRDIVLPQKIR